MKVAVALLVLAALGGVAVVATRNEPPAGQPEPRWVSIAGGALQMGAGTRADEQPIHQVDVRAFELLATEVTVAQFRVCVQAGKCQEPLAIEHCNWGQADRDTHPVNCVDWFHARDFCRWAGGRLPTEAEWEYAARGGENRPYPWGDDPADCSRVVMDEGGDGCGKGRTWPVCSRKKGHTPQGLCDMAGNVWEWVQDCWHVSYEGAPNRGSAWTSRCEGDGRVMRGGSWDDEAYHQRAARRSGDHPATCRSHSNGIRCARGSTSP